MQWLYYAIMWCTNPGFRRPDTKPFRFSHAAEEKGTYRVDYGDWMPMEIPKDPPIPKREDEKRARRLYNAFLPQIDARAEEARKVLRLWGVDVVDGPMTDPLDWELVEYALARNGEYATGDDILKHDEPERPRLRPRYYAFLYDVAYLAMQSVLRSHPDVQPRYEGEVDPSLRPHCFPVLPVKPWWTVYPLAHAIDCARVLAPEDTGDRGRWLSILFERLQDPPEEPDPEKEIHEWLDEIVADTGALPDHLEFVNMMTDIKMHPDDIPQSVLDRMELDLDAPIERH